MLKKWQFLSFGDFCPGGSLRACDCEVSHSGVICTRSEQGVGRTPLGHWGSLFPQHKPGRNGASCRRGNRNNFSPARRATSEFIFIGLFMIFGTLGAMVLFLCPYLHSSAWEVTVLPVWRSQASKHLILNAIFQLGAWMFLLSLPRVDLPCFHLLPQVWLLTAAAGDEPRPMKG